MVASIFSEVSEAEKLMVKRDQLMQVGSMYYIKIVRGRGSRIAQYKNVYSSSQLNADVIGTIALNKEPFVFLESIHIPNWWSTYKVLTSNGIYGWLQVGVDDRAYKVKAKKIL
jgi:hypothetical protein